MGKPGKNRKTHGVFKYDLDSDKNLINQKVIINESGANESTLTHELIHAATISTYITQKRKCKRKLLRICISLLVILMMQCMNLVQITIRKKLSFL